MLICSIGQKRTPAMPVCVGFVRRIHLIENKTYTYIQQLDVRDVYLYK